MSFCSNCGNKLNPEDQFCGNCGQPIHSTNTTEKTVPVKSNINYNKYYKFITNPKESFFNIANDMNQTCSLTLLIFIPIVYGFIFLMKLKSILNSVLSLFNKKFPYKIFGEQSMYFNHFIKEYSIKIFFFGFVLLLCIILAKFIAIILFNNILKKKFDYIKVLNAILASEIFILFYFLICLLFSILSISFASCIYIIGLIISTLLLFKYLTENITLSETQISFSIAFAYMLKLLVFYGGISYLCNLFKTSI